MPRNSPVFSLSLPPHHLDSIEPLHLAMALFMKAAHCQGGWGLEGPLSKPDAHVPLQIKRVLTLKV